MEGIRDGQGLTESWGDWPSGRRGVTWGCAALLVGILALAAGPTGADDAHPGSISGFVRDEADGEVLIGASVFLEEELLGCVTNVSGYYVIPRLPAGTYALVSTYIGYQRFKRQITVAPGADLKLNIALVAEAVEMEATVIRADSMRTVERLFAKPISEVRLTNRQVSQVPQVAEADLLRSLQSLPGILPLSDFSSALYVRGGTPDQNLYMVDGSDVYNPEHAFGIFSTFNTDAIKQVHLSKGGYGAEYGGRLSSILDVTNLDGNREEFEGTASVSLLSTKTTLQMPLGGLGSLSGSLRRTYFDQTVGRRIDDIPDYYFYDSNIKAYLDLGPRDKLTISGFGGRDFLDVVFNNAASSKAGIHTDWGNKTGSLRWTRVFSPQLFGNFWVTGSRFTSDFEFDEANVVERNLVTDVTFKSNLELHHSQQLVTRFGFEQKNLNVSFRQDFPAGRFHLKTRPRHYSAYGVANWRPGPLWDIESGLRYDLFDGDRASQSLDPRLSAKYRFTDTINLKVAGGVYHQYLHRIPRFIVTDIWTTSNQHQDPSRSRHLILGYQQEVGGNYQFEVEGFVKDYRNIYEFNYNFLTGLQESGYDDFDRPIINNTLSLFNRGDGQSVGVEALLRKDTGALSGWVGYSLARTRYGFDGVNSDRDYSPRHDRTSTVNAVANVDIRNAVRKLRGQAKRRDRGRWSLGVNLIYSTGQPITEPGSAYIAWVEPNDPYDQIAYAPTRINDSRLPYYGRLDVSLTYTRQIGSWTVAPYLQVFNAGNRENVWFIDYDYRNSVPDVEEQSMFPLVPTVGINVTF